MDAMKSTRLMGEWSPIIWFRSARDEIFNNLLSFLAWLPGHDCLAKFHRLFSLSEVTKTEVKIWNEDHGSKGEYYNNMRLGMNRSIKGSQRKSFRERKQNIFHDVDIRTHGIVTHTKILYQNEWFTSLDTTSTLVLRIKCQIQEWHLGQPCIVSIVTFISLFVHSNIQSMFD